MQRVFSIVALCLALSLAAWAAGIDGKWVASVERRAARKQGGPSTIEIVFDLKTDGDKLTGTVSGGGRRSASMPIENGKVAGDKISFTTVRKTRQGERKFLWDATVEGDELKGTRTPEKGRRGVPFTAKPQN